MVGMSTPSARFANYKQIVFNLRAVCMKEGEWSTMVHVPRTQPERSAETTEALITAARQLFGAQGFGEVGTERIARAAGVTRGALYHQFGDKTALFAAVLNQVEADIARRMVAAVAGLNPDDASALLMTGADAFLDACAEPEIQRIVLLDGPSVLGWERWRAICLHHSVGLIAGLLSDGIERGTIERQPVAPLTHLLVGAVDEAALYIARAVDPISARSEVSVVLKRIAGAMIRPRARQ
jgi:AcrR family transcriptional regulator